jgi:hypothetical protein
MNLCAMKRTLTLVAAWLGAAGLAVGLGFLAVSLVDTDVSPRTSLAAATTSVTGVPSTPTARTPAAPVTASSATPPAPVAVTGSAEQATAGGTVWAGCVDGTAVFAAAPAAGWRLDDDNPAVEKVEFRSASRSIEVRATCVRGTPQFVVEGPRGGRETPRVPSSAPVDDSTGKVGGGHGADDGPGDDHGGGNSGSGGHGSDD